MEPVAVPLGWLVDQMARAVLLVRVAQEPAGNFRQLVVRVAREPQVP